MKKPEKKDKYRCVYCGVLIKYEGSCDACGEKEDIALGKHGDNTL